jgi:hypothetical protein
MYVRSSLMRPGRLAAFAAVLFVISGHLAHAACTSGTVLFQDDFDSLQPTWGEGAGWLKVDAGRLAASPPPGSTDWAANTAGVYDDVDLCVTVTTLTGVTPDDARVGLVFWYADENNFYAFEYAPNGKASVWRRQRGKWLAQIKWADAPGALPGDGAENQLQVTTSGGEARFFVNGQEFKTLSGSPPENGQGIGLIAGSPDAGAARFAFDNLRVMKPAQ